MHHNKCVVIQMRYDGCVLGEAGELILHESVLALCSTREWWRIGTRFEADFGSLLQRVARS